MAGKGDRNGRWAMVIDKDGTIKYAEHETNPGQVTVRYTMKKRVETQLIEDRSLGLTPFLRSCELERRSNRARLKGGVCKNSWPFACIE